MTKKLKAQGFEVFASYDAGQRDMKLAVRSFASTLRERGKDVIAFIFYAGHGVQLKGENYLIPVDEQIKSEADVDIDAVSLSSIMSMLENSETRLAIVVLDACRDNPFGYARGGQRGLARVDAPSGSLVAFSTSPGKVAQDGPEEGNSHYTAALAEAMTEPGLKIEEVFKKVRIAVREKTRNEQTPWESTSLTGDFYPAGENAPAPKPGQHTAFVKADVAKLPPPANEDRARRLSRTFYGHTDSVRSIAFSPDGRLALSGSVDRTLRLWEVATGRQITSLRGHTGYISSVAFSPDGQWALSGSGDQSIKLWDVRLGKEVMTFTGEMGGVASVAFSPDGQTVLSGSVDNIPRLWNVATGEEIRAFKPQGDTTSVVFSPDGLTALSGGLDLKLWRISSGTMIRSFTGHGTPVNSVAFSSDGLTALSGNADGTLSLWDVSSGKETGSFAAHSTSILAVAFSHDGRYALSGSRVARPDKEHTCGRGSMKLWRVLPWRELHDFQEHSNWIECVAFSPDGRFALSGSSDQVVKLWDVSEWTQPQEVRR